MTSLKLVTNLLSLLQTCSNRKPKPETKEETPVVMAPVAGLDPLMDFAYLGMPQAEQMGQEGAEEDWGELDEDEEY